MKNNFVTEISEEDFRKLDIKAYIHEWKQVDDYHMLYWKEVKLNDLMDESDKIAEDNHWDKAKTFIFAIHTDPPKGEDIEDGYFYLDKFMTRTSQTYLQGDFEESDIKLYSTRNYWETRDGSYFKIPKNETSAVYVVRR